MRAEPPPQAWCHSTSWRGVRVCVGGWVGGWVGVQNPFIRPRIAALKADSEDSIHTLGAGLFKNGLVGVLYGPKHLAQIHVSLSNWWLAS